MEIVLALLDPAGLRIGAVTYLCVTSSARFGWAGA
jgi:hypothetical protein